MWLEKILRVLWNEHAAETKKSSELLVSVGAAGMETVLVEDRLERYSRECGASEMLDQQAVLCGRRRGMSPQFPIQRSLT